MTVRSTATYWFTIELGALIRGQIKRDLMAAAWEKGLYVDVDEAKGLTASVYRFTVSGDSDTVRHYAAAVDAWSKEMGFT